MPTGSLVIQRSSLRQQIADALRDEMLTGRLPAGGRFTVKEIADLYEVSATPVREALVDLAAQGLLEVEHHRGFTVRRFTLADFEEMVSARAMVIEALFRRIAQDGMPALPEDALASVRRRAEASVRAVLASELDVLIGCDLRFWRELTALVGNVYIHEFLDRLRVQSWMFCVPYLRRQYSLAAVCWREHTVLVDALAAGDVNRSRQILTDFNSSSLALMRRLAAERTTRTGAPADGTATCGPGSGGPGSGASGAGGLGPGGAGSGHSGLPGSGPGGPVPDAVQSRRAPTPVTGRTVR